MKSLIILSAGSLSLALLAGCASAAKSGNMIPEQISVTKRTPHSVVVTSRGGDQTKALEFSKISSEGFGDALSLSLQKSGMFRQVLKSGDADYRLDVLVVRMEQETWGLNMTAKMATHWN